MQLEHIEIAGFRGIRRLSLDFDQLTTLIGENTWGKSSLLDALSIALPADGALYQFTVQDFHVDYAIALPQTQQIQIILRFSSSSAGERKAGRYRKLKPLWQKHDDSEHADLIYRLSASRHDFNVTTQYSFLNAIGEPISAHPSEKLARDLSSLHPIIRLKDARRFERPILDSNPNRKNARIEKRISNTYRRLLATPGHVNKGEIRSSLNAMTALVEHYFSFKDHTRRNPRHERESLGSSSTGSETSFSQFLAQPHSKHTKMLFMGLLNAYLQAKGPNDLRPNARPILILEDPEGRLHPTHLARAWNLVEMLPMQKILTTNSGELLSAVPIYSIRRFVRSSDRTSALSLSRHSLSKDELRRVSFHVRFHRPSALFARCWLLVEGETEVWLFNELSRQCGYNLAAEGVQIIEFAQSGLKSLIKVAKAFGIDWHVVTDGDAAGKKYSATVRSQLGIEQERHRLTELPDQDIEHFLYHHGYEEFFKSTIKIPLDHPIPPKKVVAKVLKKFAKPDLALAIAQHSEKHGIAKIPILLRWTLKRVVTLAHGNT
jgi:putative ATP-dependent endonuclease of OLD family